MTPNPHCGPILAQVMIRASMRESGYPKLYDPEPHWLY